MEAFTDTAQYSTVQPAVFQNLFPLLLFRLILSALPVVYVLQYGPSSAYASISPPLYTVQSSSFPLSLLQEYGKYAVGA